MPFEIRRLAAFRADVAACVGRQFVSAIAEALRGSLGAPRGEHGAIVWIQRFGGSLNLNLHLHVLVLDGLFVPEASKGAEKRGGLPFHDAGRPTAAMLEGVVGRVRDRVIRWLRKKRLLDERPVEERSNERPLGTALDACAEAALVPGVFAKLDEGGAATGEKGRLTVSTSVQGTAHSRA